MSMKANENIKKHVNYGPTLERYLTNFVVQVHTPLPSSQER